TSDTTSLVATLAPEAKPVRDRRPTANATFPDRLIAGTAPRDEGRLSRNAALTGIKAAMSQLVANRCHNPPKRWRKWREPHFAWRQASRIARPSNHPGRGASLYVVPETIGFEKTVRMPIFFVTKTEGSGTLNRIRPPIEVFIRTSNHNCPNY